MLCFSVLIVVTSNAGSPLRPCSLLLAAIFTYFINLFSCCIPLRFFCSYVHAVFCLTCVTARIVGSRDDHFSTGLNNSLHQSTVNQLTVFLFSSCRIVLMDDSIDCLMSFSDFLYAFQLQFYYQGSIEITVMYIMFGLCTLCLGLYIQLTQFSCSPY